MSSIQCFSGYKLAARVDRHLQKIIQEDAEIKDLIEKKNLLEQYGSSEYEETVRNNLQYLRTIISSLKIMVHNLEEREKNYSNLLVTIKGGKK